MNRIHRLADLGQSVWLDFLDRHLLASGELRRLVREGVVRGVTSNPTIFQKALAGSSDYDALIGSATPFETDASVLERVMVRDLTLACDELRPVYEQSLGQDGFASIEVDPNLANDSGAQVEQAVRLWGAVDRPNLMVKIPGTRAGLPAIESCLAHGIAINVTLLFSVSRYREVVEAFLRALERRVHEGAPIDRIASVASFFVSRVDTKLDKLLDAMPNALRGAAGSLRGQVAIANAKNAYQEYESILATERWKVLAARGARPQRLLWASTSPKDPLYPDTYYTDALVGRGTIDTMTRESLHAYLDHGAPEERIAKDRDLVRSQLRTLRELQVDLGSITDQLEAEGVASFVESYRRSIQAIAEKRAALGGRAPTAHI